MSAYVTLSGASEGPPDPPPGGPREGQHEHQALRERKKTQRPRPWKVLLHNDDFTTMDFVVHILMKYFRKTGAEATHVMLQVHRKGIGTAGVYPRDIAETKVREVTEEAREQQQPLKVTAEPE